MSDVFNSPKKEKSHLLLPIFFGVEIISVKFLKSNLYTQYHCLPLILIVNKLDSACHSNNFNKKFEFTKILKHQKTGIIQIIKSPHFPWGLNEETILGLNFIVLNLKTLANNIKYNTQKKENQNHHQYCHCARCINISELVFENIILKFVL